MYNICRVDGLLKFEGILVVCKSALYSIDNFNITSDNNIVELEEMQVRWSMSTCLYSTLIF